MPRSAPHFPTAAIWEDWRTLCTAIGERRAGTNGEARAAAYIAAQFDMAGLAPEIETFSCRSLRRADVSIHAQVGASARWERTEATALVGAPGTTKGKAVEGEPVWLELPEGGGSLKRGSLRGKIALVFGPLPTVVATHQRLMAANPLAVVHVDDRLPFSWTKNDGVYPHWADTYGMPPTLAVPYLDAWRWRRNGLRRLRVRASVDLTKGVSQNVVAALPGAAPHLPAIIVTAHHDTQCGNEGADDNASGVVALLALARSLRKQRLQRTLRFISFGTEEQLSVGSAAYVHRHRITPRQAGIVINFDSIASPLGHWDLFVAGADRLASYAIARLANEGMDVAAHRDLIPFSDHFPFNRVGVPSLWFMRSNFPGGRWQHHSPHDTLANVSDEPLQQLLLAVRPLLLELARRSKWPFPSQLPPAQMAAARKIGRDLFGPENRR